VPGDLTITAPRTAYDLQVGKTIHGMLRQKGADARLSYDGGHVRIRMPFRDQKDLGLALDASTAWSMRQLQDAPLPPLYQAGVVYKREPECRLENGVLRLCEEFLTARCVYARHAGDCDDLGAWRAAELRLAGEKANAYARRSAAGWHVVVRRGDGSTEDPSAILGMPTS
jgi:hypothetical protein